MKRLDPGTWKRLAPLLDAALELPDDARSAFVEEQLGDEPELRALLEELIAAERRSGGLLDDDAVELEADLRAEVVAEAPPRIEGYSDLEEIGRGGMGIVYRATRRGEDFEQVVAVKVVRRGLDDATLRQRFSRERKILARLDHPHIARLVDGGTTDDGRSYFAMEYVDGVPITRYADEERLTVAQRLRLFEDVCDAVRFAQQRLVVHRDLKPSNILVDGSGRVRLLDFGIARLLEDDNAGEAELTREGGRLLTPEYAAPEQVRGEPPSTATDVYALGVILFELLSGRHPHGPSRAGSIEVAMGLRESTSLPEAVSGEHQVLRADGTVETITDRMVADSRRTSPRALRRALGGELATITAKALRTDPAARYASAEALLADLVRYREGRPLEARAPSWTYRTRKYLRRHRASVTAATLVVLALGVGLGLSLWQGRVAAREAERAQRAYEFLSGLFEDAHPDAAQGTDWTASQLLVRGAERLADAWPDDLEARAELQRNIAFILTERGDYDAAADVLTGALAREDLPTRTATVLALARVELYRGRSASADSLLDALDAAGTPLDEDARTRYLESAASIQYVRGAYAEAESLIRIVMDRTVAEHGERSRQYASDLNNLAIYQADQAHYEEAEATYRRVLDLLGELRPVPLTDIALAHHNLADLYRVVDRDEEAQVEFAEAVRLREQLYPDGHDRLAESLRGLAMTYSALGELDVADSLLARAVDMIDASVGSDHLFHARALNDLAVLAYRRQDLDTARERFARANDLFERALGPTHPNTLTVTNNLAIVQSMTGHAEEAEKTFRLILERRREVLGDDHPDVAFSYNSVGQVLRRLERPEEAVASHREALRRYLEIHGPDNLAVATTRTQLGGALRHAGHYDEAIEQLELALAVREAQLPANHRDIADTRLALGYTFTFQGRWELARETLLVAEAELDVAQGPDSIWLAGAHVARGLCLVRLGRAEEGRALAEDGYARIVAEKGEDDIAARRARRFLAMMDD